MLFGRFFLGLLSQGTLGFWGPGIQRRTCDDVHRVGVTRVGVGLQCFGVEMQKPPVDHG